MVRAANEEYDNYEPETLERACRGIATVSDWVLRTLEIKQINAHTEVKRRQRTGMLEREVAYDKDTSTDARKVP